MTRRPPRYPLVFDARTIRDLLLTSNVDALALHHPGRDGLCPICRERLCDIRLRALRVVRAAGIRVSVMPAHEPTRPAWWCESCACDWPCSQARVMLGDEYEADRIGLAARMTELMRQAREELPHVRAAELRTRFVEWVRW